MVLYEHVYSFYYQIQKLVLLLIGLRYLYMLRAAMCLSLAVVQYTVWHLLREISLVLRGTCMCVVGPIGCDVQRVPVRYSFQPSFGGRKTGTVKCIRSVIRTHLTILDLIFRPSKGKKTHPWF